MKVHTVHFRQIFSTRLPTRWGVFQVIGFERLIVNGSRHTETALAIILGDLSGSVPLVRIHSQCLTGEVFGSLRCDCNDQLELAMQAIANEQRGLVIYEHQEGRGIGLMAKLQAYELQDAGLDTVEANHALGFEEDCRDFQLPAAILQALGIDQVRLLTNNPRKVLALQHAGINVLAEVRCEAAPTPHSFAYLRAKKERMGHALTLEKAGRFGLAGHRITTDPDPRRSIVDNSAGHAAVFASIEDAINELRAGRMVVIVDDDDRENEGDLTIAAEMISPEAVTFMATHGRGLICLAMTGERIDELQFEPMAAENNALGGTAFTVSIDFIGPRVTTGISSHDRAQTIKATVDVMSQPADFARPGHVFPLRARPGGVLERRGHTEAAVDLAAVAGLFPAGVICEIVNDDGTMARGADLVRFCARHGLLMVTVADLARYRLECHID